MLHNFLEKTKKKPLKTKTSKSETDHQESVNQPQQVTEEQEKLRKRVSHLMKKQKLKQLKGIVKAQNESKPWGQEYHVKVCLYLLLLMLIILLGGARLIMVLFFFQIGCRLIQLLTETAYIQPPNQPLGDAPPDIRPAFTHTLKNVMKESQ